MTEDYIDSDGRLVLPPSRQRSAMIASICLTSIGVGAVGCSILWEHTSGLVLAVTAVVFLTGFVLFGLGPVLQ